MDGQDRADYKQPDLHIYDQEYELLDDIWDLLATQAQLARYLPRRGKGPTLESDESYLLRLQTTSPPRAFRDGIERAVGRFGVADFTEETPDAIKDLGENIDGFGCNIDNFVFRVLVNLLRYGCMAILVDFIDDAPRAFIVPVAAISNRAFVDKMVQLLTVEHFSHELDKYGINEVLKYKEYRPGLLIEWQKDKKTDELHLVNETPLTEAGGNLREEVYAVWLSVDPESKPWTPCSPALLGLAKKSILQMLKTSELDRAETICNMQIIKRTHPQGVDPADAHPDIDWDPEAVQEIPFGGKLEVDEPKGTSIQTTHDRNKDRQAEMDRAVDAWLMEKIRTATESGIADDAEKSRLEIITKTVQRGMSEVFRFMMQLADRRFNPEVDDVGGITLSATAYDQVTDEEIQMATQDFTAGALSLTAVQKIKLDQWRSRGYEISEEDMLAQSVVPNEIIEA